MKPVPGLLSATAVFLFATFVWSNAWPLPAGQRAIPHATRQETPGARTSPVVLNDPSLHPDHDKQAVAQGNQQELRQEIQHLYALAAELKEVVDQTDSSSVLSVSVLRHAQEIEKLARRIKDQSRRQAAVQLIQVPREPVNPP